MLKINIGQYQIVQRDPYQFTVGRPYTDSKGDTVYLSDPRYFPKLSLALDYIQKKVTLEQDITTVEELRAANEEALDNLRIWIETTPLKDLEVPQ